MVRSKEDKHTGLYVYYEVDSAVGSQMVRLSLINIIGTGPCVNCEPVSMDADRTTLVFKVLDISQEASAIVITGVNGRRKVGKYVLN